MCSRDNARMRKMTAQQRQALVPVVRPELCCRHIRDVFGCLGGEWGGFMMRDCWCER